MTKGYVAMVLHAHLPYVRHPESERVLEEKWFYEANTETYLPLIAIFNRLIQDGVPFKITLSLSPTLLSMWLDPLLQQRYLHYLRNLLELLDKEVVRTAHQPHFANTVQMYQRNIAEVYSLYHERYQDNLVNAFRALEQSGQIELITCGATHGYLPLIGLQRGVVATQIKVAVDYFHQLFGHRPRGFWLPECAYTPGDDAILAANGIEYFFVDTHGILYASPRPRYSIYAPLRCPAGVAAFGRDLETSRQVWSAQEGYPGDCDYREFYRDIAYELDDAYIAPFLHVPGLRSDTGLKYYKITGKTEHKAPYIPEHGRGQAALHAGNFMFNRERQIEYLAQHMDRQPLVVCPYDAELFGHWWFEGPQWLDFLFRKAAFDQHVFQFTTPGEYLDRYPNNQPATPSMSSWGCNGYNEVWLEGSNDWIYRHLHQAGATMVRLSNGFTTATELETRALNQAARELLLAESSDWAFIMKTGTMVNYAVRRTTNHVGRFLRLADQLQQNCVDELWLEDLEGKDNLYPNIDYRSFATS